jgi:phosphohistidine phosphatase
MFGAIHGQYGASSADLMALACQTSADVRTLLIVGHDPAMRDLTLELASGQPGDTEPAALSRVRAKYPTAAIAVLSFSGNWSKLSPGQAQLTHFVTPSDLGAGHHSRR